jgi:hypothetical protein
VGRRGQSKHHSGNPLADLTGLLQLFSQYAHVKQRIPELVNEIASQRNNIASAEQREECKKMATIILPRLMSTLSRLLRHSVGVRYRIALDDMHANLVRCANALNTLGIAERRVALDMSIVESGARLKAVHEAAFDRFCKTLELEIGA